MKIGELARWSGCQTETIRYYEAQGLLQPPGRAANNYREYGPSHLERLAFILRCRSLNLSQAEVRALILLQERPEKSCDDVNELLDRHLSVLSERISQLEVLRRQLQDIRAACGGESCVDECGALGSLRAEAVAGVRSKRASRRSRAGVERSALRGQERG
ncbi:MAG TPA: Cd(II)/Pb(II)-responsive transcriptional regulator [Burkholderiaceae bacterium]|nr:Cd(II)/Pb(II)-responsive transcriptional regulator [Burkholderiaceae bacterium]